MDVIERAIRDKTNISRYDNINCQTWQEFNEKAVDKKIILWGVGIIAHLFWERCDRIEDIIVIDNDKSKQGISAKEFLFREGENKTDAIVQSADALENVDYANTVVVISALNGYNDIIQQVKSLGFTEVYVMLIMESNKRISDNKISESIYEKIVRNSMNNNIDQSKVFIRGFGSYSDHAKYITEALLKIRNDLDIVWAVSDLKINVPDGIRKVHISNIERIIYEIETAHVWLINTMMPDYIIKRSGQIYIHTKHWASITLKKFYLGASTITDNQSDVDNWKYNSNMMDYIITGSLFDEESCRSGFEFNGKFIRAGSPRSDAMFQKNKNQKIIHSVFNIPSNSRTALYAPTYRYNTKGVNHIAESRNIELDFQMIREALINRFGGNWTIVLRLHPSVQKYSHNIKKTDFVVDASLYNDGEELASACDILISDYSSILFEPAFVRKPVFLFATDITEYIDKEYDLLIDYYSLPFPIAETNEQLVENIMNFDNEKYIKDVDAFMEKYDVHEDGHASERAAQFISDLIDRKVDR